jgi:uncharacterized membrane protein required for colicin V production
MWEASRVFLDILALIIIALGAATGRPSGTAHQLVHLAFIVAASYAARLGLPTFAGFVHRIFGAEVENAVGGCYLVMFAIWFGVTWLAAEAISDRVRDAQVRKPFDRHGGALLGACKGAALVYIVAVGFLTMNPEIASGASDDQPGQVVSYVQKHNFLRPSTDGALDEDDARQDDVDENPWRRLSE